MFAIWFVLGAIGFCILCSLCLMWLLLRANEEPPEANPLDPSDPIFLRNRQWAEQRMREITGTHTLSRRFAEAEMDRIRRLHPGIAMGWHDAVIGIPDGGAVYHGKIQLLTASGDDLASVVWFSPEGPFYAHAQMPDSSKIMYRIGPCGTLDGAKQLCMAVVEGRKDVSRRASYG